MKLSFPVLSLLCVMPGAVFAAEWKTKPNDRPLPVSELASLAGRSFTFYDGGETLFGDRGAYSYTFAAQNGGGTAWGSYHIAEDGSVCVDFTNGTSRCDLYVRNGDRIVLITEAGERFPVQK